MSQLNANINDDLDKEFRYTVLEELGGKKGTLKIALEEAIELWINSKKDRKK